MHLIWKNAFGFAAFAATLVSPGAHAAQAGRERDASSGPLQAPNRRVFTLRLKDGEYQRLLYVASGPVKATIVMLPGGAGNVGIAANGSLAHGDNFLVRTRGLWTAKGFAVVIPDAIGRQSLRGQRHTVRYAHVVERIVAFAEKESKTPVFLLGTSQGAIAAANAAANAQPGTVAGVALTESVSRSGGSHETVFDADLAAIRVPVLIVANKRDRCPVARPADAARIAAALSGSPSVTVSTVTGGSDRSGRPCGSLSPHGYRGMEQRVVGIIGRWMLKASTSH